MTRATLPNSVLAQLPELNSQFELCNEEGQTLGFFLPPELHREYMYAWAKAQFTGEESERTREETLEEIRNGGGMTTSEVLAHIQSVIDSHGKS